MAFTAACGGGSSQLVANSGAPAEAPKQEAAKDKPYKGEKLVVGIWGGGHVDVITINVQ